MPQINLMIKYSILGFISLFVLLISNPLIAQSDSLKKSAYRARYFELKGSVSQLNVRDHLVSPLTQSGLQIGGFIGYKTMDFKRIIEVEAGGFTGNLTNDLNLNNTVHTSIQALGNFTYLHRILKTKSEKWRLFIGGEVSMWYAQRTNSNLFNASLVYDYHTDLLLSGYIERGFEIKPLKYKLFKKQHSVIGGEYLFQFKAATSVASNSIRTPYTIISYPDRNLTENENGFNGFNTRALVITETALWHYLPNGNALKLGYDWYLSWLNRDAGKLEVAQHIFSFSFIFRINSKQDEGR